MVRVVDQFGRIFYNRFVWTLSEPGACAGGWWALGIVFVLGVVSSDIRLVCPGYFGVVDGSDCL